MPTITIGRDILRRVILIPYAQGQGPRFTLEMWDTHTLDWRGCTRIGYRFFQCTAGDTPGHVVFEGSDFCGSPMHADDSDACVASLLTFLTLRPGDTDAEYFSEYTEAQHEFASQHAEALSCYCMDRFGEH